MRWHLRDRMKQHANAKPAKEAKSPKAAPVKKTAAAAMKWNNRVATSFQSYFSSSILFHNSLTVK